MHLCIEVTNVPVDIIYDFLLAEVLQIINDATTWNYVNAIFYNMVLLWLKI